MKHFYLFIAILVFVLLFSACSKDTGDLTTTAPVEATTDTTASEETETDSTETTTTEAEETTTLTGVFYGERTGTEKTKTGLEPLDKITLTLPAGADYSEYPNTLIEHGFGAASGGVVSPLSENNQKFMEEHGFNALCWDNKTEEKVLYLTFDVGYENGYTEKVLDTLKEKDVPAAFFVTVPEMKDNPTAIARMINEGHIVGNHSTSHPNFTKLSQEEMIKEIQGFDDYIRENFGYSSMFFRYPEGKYSQLTEKTITDLGFTSVFWSLAYADWDLNNQLPAKDAFDTVISRLHPGAVILLHAVSPVNYEILADVIDEARQQGYEFRTLTSYVENR